LERDLRNLAIGASLAASVLMLVGKIGAAWLTHSSAILSDAAESVIHIFATAAAAASLKYAALPADREHPYGHGRIAYFSAGFEGALISIAALSILALAGNALVEGPQVQQLGLGLLITFSLAMVNLALGTFLVRVGKKHESMVLVANGQHVLSDMWTSLAVVVGVLLVWVTEIVWLDPVVAMLAALHILREGWKLMRDAFQGLMDAARPEDTQTLLRVLDDLKARKVIEDFHQLHHRRANDHMWIEVHLLLPAHLQLLEAHEQACQAERELMAAFPGVHAYITSHLEPTPHHAAHPEGHREPDDPLSPPLACAKPPHT
jgi:cation diffusion facilitator family transporter